MTLLTILLTIVLVGVLFAAMAVGVMLGRKPIKGSCGGLGAAGVEGGCDVCGGKPERCTGEGQDGKAS